jgi:hypothetical protein
MADERKQMHEKYCFPQVEAMKKQQNMTIVEEITLSRRPVTNSHALFVALPGTMYRARTEKKRPGGYARYMMASQLSRNGSLGTPDADSRELQD